jgi:hypothetical protein
LRLRLKYPRLIKAVRPIPAQPGEPEIQRNYHARSNAGRQQQASLVPSQPAYSWLKTSIISLLVGFRVSAPL